MRDNERVGTNKQAHDDEGDRQFYFYRPYLCTSSGIVVCTSCAMKPTLLLRSAPPALLLLLLLLLLLSSCVVFPFHSNVTWTEQGSSPTLLVVPS